ncbi:MAG TPA: hypothetical protein VFR24_27300 [Candidatus Angelobacter sp.]|nr:hypothetical protein [Candidatus Angelobacter sp.]
MSVVANSPPHTSEAVGVGLASAYTLYNLTWLPGAVVLIGGILGMIWYAICIWESKTVQTWRSDRTAKKKLRRISKLKAEERIIAAALASLGGGEELPSTTKEIKVAAERALDEHVKSQPSSPNPS